MPNRLQNRNGIWLYLRRVPKEFSHLDRRKVVKHSTKIRVNTDRTGIRAMQAAARIDVEVEAYWRGLVTGQTLEAQRRYDDARRRARSLGFTYAPAETIAQASLNDILARLDKLSMHGGVRSARDVAALMGGEAPPAILLSSLVDAYEGLVRTDIRDLSPDQLRKWRNQKRRAAENLIAVIGDKPITAVTREDILDYREWWQNRVVEDGLDNVTANKNMGRLSAMFRVIELKLRLGLTPVFAGLRLGAGEESKREPFEPAFVQSKILRTGALDSLNPEARRVIYIMTETGMRPAEIVNLTEQTIILDAKVPHVMVRPDGRRMKTDESRRELPLVGVALAAARAQPNGFPRYRDKSASLSGAVNKFLTENGFRPSPNHTLYSLRHTFEDRLTAVEAPEKLIANLMGHKYGRPRYGKGPSLAQKQKWLLKIAFKAPTIV